MREFPGGSYVVVVVGKERESNGKEGIFHQGAHLHTHIGAHTYTHIHDKGGGGWDGESFPRVKVYTDCRLGFFSSSSFWRIVKQQHRETSGFIKYWMGSKLFEFFGTRRR